MQSLRSLLVDIYPPNLARGGPRVGAAELAAGVERGGMAVELDVDSAASPAAEAGGAALSRSRRRRCATSSPTPRRQPRRACVPASSGSAPCSIVDDDGRGFAPDELAERGGEGHVGLRSLGDLVRTPAAS